MPGTKEIRGKIASVKSTQKITKAMQMVATSKMRRAQERMRMARPYAEKIRSVIGNLAQANPDERNAFLQERPDVKHVGVIVISSDRGLCGSLNATTFKSALIAMRDWQAKGASTSRSRLPIRKRRSFSTRAWRSCCPTRMPRTASAGWWSTSAAARPS